MAMDRETRLARKRESARKHYQEHLDEMRARRRARYLKHRDAELQQNRERRKTNGHQWHANKRRKHRANPAINMLQTAKTRARRNGLEFDLTMDDIVIPKKCPALGISLSVGNGHCLETSPSLDRIDNNKGYVRGNVVVVSLKANTIKSNASLDDLRRVLTFYEGIQ